MEDEFESPHILDPEDEEEEDRRNAQDILDQEDDFERLQIQSFLQDERLQMEDTENPLESSDDDRDVSGVASTPDFTFNTQLTSLHSYLGDFDDTRHRRHRSAFWEGGAILNLPLFHLKGVVLFPEATLPLRVIERKFVAAVNRAMTQADAPYTMGVIRVYKDSVDGPLRLANIGTTAEIRQYRSVEDGSINVVTRGRQRFRLRRSWNDVEGAPCAEVQIIEEDVPFRTKSMTRKVAGRRSHLSSTVSRAFWPIWVYHMYDPFCLAQKAADMWKHIVGTPSMDCFVEKPVLLSFYIASKIPVSEPTRQELLEIDSISYRLRREIELLKRLDRVRCKICKSGIARRSDMLVMSSDGPLGAYVDENGFVHEIMTFREAKGLVLRGLPVKEYSWFPGYAWRIIYCCSCKTQIGWLFTRTNKKLTPTSFWGISSCQVTDESNFYGYT